MNPSNNAKLMATRSNNRIVFSLTALLMLASFFVVANCTKSKRGNDGGNGTPDPGDTTVSPPPQTPPPHPAAGILFKQYLGVNGFEWEFLNNANELSQTKTAHIKPFAEFRHYLDWHRIEDAPGEYTFSPSASGGWSYDAIYTWCKQNGVNVLVCLKTVPDWFLQAHYPANQRDEENVPAPYNADKKDPASYIQFAKVAFQFAARYGSNADIDANLVSVAPKPSWSPNQKKIGLSLIKYIECNNEPDRWWKGTKAQQSPEEYAANLSAFYDGHKGRLGRDVGVKQADPNMVVVMGGIANPDPEFIRRMVEWCRTNRGYRSDGTVDLCFDVINYHHYSNNKQSDWSAPGVRGEAPELSESPKIAQAFVELSKNELNGMEIWVTELGYDVNPSSPQRALAIPSAGKSIMDTQADWIIRSSLMYSRIGVNRIHFYMLNDVDVNNPTQYSSSGFLTAAGQRRPSLNYIIQLRELLGEFSYRRTIDTNPYVDLYEANDRKIYALVIPDERGRTATYNLNVGNAQRVKVYSLRSDSETINSAERNVVGGVVSVQVSETPIFVEVL